MKIFGREPAWWTSLIAAVLAVALSIDKFSLDPEQVALIMAVVTAAFGVYTAYVTDETMLSFIVGLAQSVLALAVGFGLDLSTDLSAALIALVTIVAGGYERTQNTPAVTPSFSTPGVLESRDPLPGANPPIG